LVIVCLLKREFFHQLFINKYQLFDGFFAHNLLNYNDLSASGILTPTLGDHMKFIANSTDLQRTLAKLAGVIPAKSTMPILENILFSLQKNVLTLTATDLTISLTATMTVQGIEEGTIAVPAKRLVETIRALPDTSVTFMIDLTSNKIKIVTDDGEYGMSGESAAEYPQMQKLAKTAQATLDAELLKRIIHQTAFAVSSDELRPAMTGVLLQAPGKELRAVATDGHRLVRFTRKADKAFALNTDVVIPAKSLNILGKVLEGQECTITLSEKHVQFSFEGSSLISRVIEERYPNYESVIPADNTKIMTVKRDRIVAAIRRVALYASATTHQVRFDLDGSSLKLTAQDIDFGGEAKETIAAAYAGEPMSIGFNSQYLVDILTHLDTEDVQFKFSSPTRAGIVAPPDGNAQEDLLMLVMPVRLNA
jgi:DNA polymerase III subunit beta